LYLFILDNYIITITTYSKANVPILEIFCSISISEINTNGNNVNVRKNTMSISFALSVI